MLTDRGAAGARTALAVVHRGEGQSAGGFKGAGGAEGVKPSRTSTMAARAITGGRVFEVLDTVDFGVKASSCAKITGREGLRAGGALLQRCGTIKAVSGTSGSQAAKRWHEDKVVAPRAASTSVDGDVLVSLLSEGQPDVATIVTRARKAGNALPTRTFVRARRGGGGGGVA